MSQSNIIVNLYEKVGATVKLITGGGLVVHTHQNTVNGGILDHGLALSGLADDDHIQYLLANGARGLSADWNAGSRKIDLGTKGIATTTKARAYLNTLQTNIPDLTWTKVLLDEENYDPGNNFDKTTNHRFVFPVPGIYLIIGSLLWSNTIENKSYGIGIYFDSSFIGSVKYSISPYGGSLLTQSLTDIHLCNANQYIEFMCYHDSGVSTEDIYNGSGCTFLSVHLLSVA